jgi:MFS family permease
MTATATTTTTTVTAASLRRSLFATAGLFAALGLGAGAWGAHVQSVKARYGLDEAALSWLLFAAALGVIGALLVAARLVARFGVRACVMAGALGLGGALAAALHAPGWPVLVVLMLVMGASMGVFDVAINTEGSLIESLGARAVMGRLHALFSLGGMLGAGAASALFAAGVSAAVQLLLLGAAVVLLAAATSPRLLPVHPAGDAALRGVPLRQPLIWLLGGLALAALLAEGVMYDWSVLYLSQELHWPASLAALGFAVFSGAMALARFGADALRMRWSEARVLAAGGALAALAMALLLWRADPWVALAGYALVGVGLASAAPILYAAATRIPGVSRAQGIAAVSSIGYVGFMLGPPLVGAVAKAVSLSAAMAVVVVASALLALLARYVPAAHRAHDHRR